MSKDKIRIGISPCPNDTFIFDALIHKKIDVGDFDFEVEHLDVEALNKSAAQKEFDLCKLSYATIAGQSGNYQVLTSGGALGKGVGPLLIAEKELTEEEIDQALIAIPGEHTTANFLLSLAYPRATQKKEMLFSEIEDAVLRGEADAGLIIHENRFTYRDKGLIALMDLGNYWEELSSSLIPLGGIAVKRQLEEEIKRKLNKLLQASVEYAFARPDSSNEYVKRYATEMNEDVIQKHIELYVNQYSVDLGREGKEAVETFFQKAKEKELITEIVNPIFVS